MEFQNITLDKKEGIATLTLNRPPVNIIDCDMLVELNTALEQVAKDDEVKVLLLRGSGNRAFSAGVEIKDHIGEKMPKMMKEFGRVFHLLRGLGKPSIAVVNGVALGGGCELVAGCDMAIASEKAQLGQPEIKLGGLAPAAASLFPRIMGEKKALGHSNIIKGMPVEKFVTLTKAFATGEQKAMPIAKNSSFLI